MIPPIVIKYAVILLVCGLVVFGIYQKGYNDASNKYERQQLEAQVAYSNKLDKVEELSKGIADLIAATSGSTTEKLDSILSKSKDKPLTSVPCTPSQDFVTSWNELNKVTK